MGPRYRQRLTRILTLVVPATLVFCASPQGKGPVAVEPDFVGFITVIDRQVAGDSIARLGVESHADKLVRRHVVTITRGTVLLTRDGDVSRPTNIDALVLKSWVRLWFSDSGRREYPTEVTAAQLEVVDRP